MAGDLVSEFPSRTLLSSPILRSRRGWTHCLKVLTARLCGAGVAEHLLVRLSGQAVPKGRVLHGRTSQKLGHGYLWSRRDWAPREQLAASFPLRVVHSAMAAAAGSLRSCSPAAASPSLLIAHLLPVSHFSLALCRSTLRRRSKFVCDIRLCAVGACLPASTIF